MNWIDLIFIIIFVLYVYDGYRRGFMRLAWELIGLVVAFFGAIKFYLPLSNFFVNVWHFDASYSRPVSFLLIWAVTQGVFYLFGKLLAYYVPALIKQSRLNQYLGIIPAILKGVILVIVICILFLMLPISENFKDKLANSFFGKNILKVVAGFQENLEDVFMTEPLIAKKESIVDEKMSLGFTTTSMEVDEIGEDEMLGKINEERKKAGLKELKQDNLIRNVARASSRDKLNKGYFSHITPEGQTLFDRLKLANVTYIAAGENIALSPTVDLAHIGLMNSPTHRANILDPSFTRVGIGIMDAGSYGLMITQNFAN